MLSRRISAQDVQWAPLYEETAPETKVRTSTMRKLFPNRRVLAPLCFFRLRWGLLSKHLHLPLQRSNRVEVKGKRLKCYAEFLNVIPSVIRESRNIEFL